MTTGDEILERLSEGARGVLDANWLGASTLPSRTLYPHQWSWDSAFMAIGRSWYDEPRAQQELRSLFRAQWADGRVPHIVFNPSVGGGGVLPRAGVLAVVEAVRRGAARRRDLGHHPAARPCPGRARDAPARARRRRLEGVPRLAVPAARRRARLPRPAPAPGRLRRCRCSCTRGSPGSTTRPRGIATSPGWPSRRARSRPTSATTSTTRTPPTGRPTRPTTGSCTSRPRIARRGTTTPGCSRRSRSSSPARCSTRSTCGRRMPWRTSPRSSAPTRRPTARTRSGSTTRSSASSGTRSSAGSAPSTWSSNERSVEDTIISFAPLLDPDLPAAQLAAIMADLRSAHFHPDRPERVRRAQLRPHGRGLRRAPLLARARLDQHELDPVGRPAPARPARRGRGDRRCPACGSSTGRASTSTSTRSTARASAPRASAGPRP